MYHTTNLAHIPSLTRKHKHKQKHRHKHTCTHSKQTYLHAPHRRYFVMTRSSCLGGMQRSRAQKTMCSSTVRDSNNTLCCGQMPRPSRMAVMLVRTSLPQTYAVPSVGGSRPVRTPMVVVLPAPLWPSSDVMPFCCASKLRSSTARCARLPKHPPSPRYTLLMWSTRMPTRVLAGRDSKRSGSMPAGTGIGRPAMDAPCSAASARTDGRASPRRCGNQ